MGRPESGHGSDVPRGPVAGDDGSAPADSAPRGLRRSLVQRGVMLGLGLVVCAVDQWTKALVAGSMAHGESNPVLGTVMSLTRRTNPGGAFGVMPDHTALLSVVSAVVILVLLVAGPRLAGGSRVVIAGLGLVLGGAAGNLLDRVRLGHVEDFIDFHFWPVFNVADIGITVGAGLLVLAVLLEGRNEGRR